MKIVRSTLHHRTFSGEIRLAFFLSCVALWLGLMSCSQSAEKQQTEATEEMAQQTEESAEDRNEERFEGKNEKDADFLSEVSQMNLEEIELGKLAQQSSLSKEVKKLGEMMVDAHSKSQKALEDLASSKGVALPGMMSEDGVESVARFKGIRSQKFDGDYCEKMIEAHEKAVSKFENQMENGADQDIKNWASAMLPELKAHLQLAKDCKLKINHKS